MRSLSLKILAAAIGFSALAVTAAETNIPPVPNQNLDFWMNQLESESADIQINALQKLAELKEVSTVPRLLAAAKDDNSEVRFHAAKALSRIPERSSLEGLEQIVNLEKDPYVKSEMRRSIKSLSEILNKTKP